MRKLLLLLSTFLLFSCGMSLPKHEYVVTYSFVNVNTISDTEKKETVEIIKKRLQKFTRNVDVSIDSNNVLSINLKTDFKIERLNTIVLNQGKLDFWSCYTQEEIMPFITDANKAESNDIIANPFYDMFQGMASDGLFHIAIKDSIKFKDYLNKPKVKLLFTKDYKDLKFLFGLPFEEFIPIYAIKSNEKGKALINETSIVEVRQDYDQLSRPAISIRMNELGAHNWSKITNEAYEKNSKIAITINDIVYSAPGVVSGPIIGGRSQISGDFSIEEAQNLSYILSSRKSIPKLKFIKVSEIEN